MFRIIGEKIHIHTDENLTPRQHHMIGVSIVIMTSWRLILITWRRWCCKNRVGGYWKNLVLARGLCAMPHKQDYAPWEIFWDHINSYIWPCNSPDVIICEGCCWVADQQNSDKKNPQRLTEVKDKDSACQFKQKDCRKAYRIFWSCLEAVVQANGNIFE